MKYTHILFDADDTLFDFQKTERHALLEFFSDIGIAPDEENTALYHRINQGWWDKLERGETTFDQLIVRRMTDFLTAVGIKTDPTAPTWDMRDYLAKFGFVFDGAEELLARLHPHCKMYIITNGIARVQRSRMDRSPIKHYFTHFFISQEIGYTKPAQGFFDHVLGHLGDVDRSKILVVGDSLVSDITGGANAGLDTCWYNPHGKDSGNLRPTYTVRTHSEIGDIILS